MTTTILSILSPVAAFAGLEALGARFAADARPDWKTPPRPIA